jgi:hypothetical protein
VHAQHARDCWLATCDAVNRLEPKYGQKTIAQFAADTGADYETLKRYLSVYKKWLPHWGAPPQSRCQPGELAKIVKKETSHYK